MIVLILLSSPLIVNTVEYYQLKWTMILTCLNLIEFRSLTCFSLLTCHGVGYLRKSHYMLCASDPLYFQKNCWLQKYANVTKLFCMLRAFWLSETCIYHIIIYLWRKVKYMWPVMEFPQISCRNISVKGSK